ncbi:MAG: addiction module protein [Thiothrix litoralis]|uniref:addiction module protein n=1 Tax=Thiothrix litoralis TaxID=2891210 RepID=UPI003C748D47
MTALATHIADEAMQLPSDERIALIDMLLKSLNIPTQHDIDALWMAEAEKRVRDIASGAVEMLEGEQVFREIRQRLQ